MVSLSISFRNQTAQNIEFSSFDTFLLPFCCYFVNALVENCGPLNWTQLKGGESTTYYRTVRYRSHFNRGFTYERKHLYRMLLLWRPKSLACLLNVYFFEIISSEANLESVKDIILIRKFSLGQAYQIGGPIGCLWWPAVIFFEDFEIFYTIN